MWTKFVQNSRDIIRNTKDTSDSHQQVLEKKTSKFKQPLLGLKIDLVAKGLGINHIVSGGARGVMVIVVGNGHGDTSSNPGQDWFHFT